MTTDSKPRFIAGAVCPRCGKMDVIKAWRAEGRQLRACVACDFEDSLQFPDPVRELETRVNGGGGELQVVKLLGPDKS